MDVGIPKPSPDGEQVAYVNLAGGWGFLEVVPMAGGTPRRLTTQSELVYHTGPEWSPDGSLIAVEDDILGTNGQDLVVVSWPGGEWQRLPMIPGVWMTGPQWTPDGRGLAHVQTEPRYSIVALPMAAPAAPQPWGLTRRRGITERSRRTHAEPRRGTERRGVRARARIAAKLSWEVVWVPHPPTTILAPRLCNSPCPGPFASPVVLRVSA